MNVEFTGRGTEVTEALKQFATDKLKKMSRFVDNIMDVSITFSVEKHRHTAEIIMRAGHDRLVAKETTNDMYSSIGGALDKLEKQAKKLKTRMVRKRKPESRPAAGAGDSVETEGEPRLVPISLTQFKPMTMEEALLSLDNGPDPFLIFKDHDNGEALTILFNRPDGTIGVVTLG